VYPTSRRDRSGSNLSNTDANVAAAISAQLSLSAGTGAGEGSSSGSNNSGNAIPLGMLCANYKLSLCGNFLHMRSVCTAPLLRRPV
jgi:hypothetical protein